MSLMWALGLSRRSVSHPLFALECLVSRMSSCRAVQWKSRLRSRLDKLPDDGGKRLMGMEREARNEPALRRLAVDLCAKWRNLLCHKRMRGVCDTNNVTERVIGKSKIKYKTIRSYKYRGNDERAVANITNLR